MVDFHGKPVAVEHRDRIAVSNGKRYFLRLFYHRIALLFGAFPFLILQNSEYGRRIELQLDVNRLNGCLDTVFNPFIITRPSRQA